MKCGRWWQTLAVLQLFILVPLQVAAQCPPGLIAGHVYRDYDTNGDRDDNAEPGISGIQVSLIGIDGNILATTTTSFAGYYSFSVTQSAEYGLLLGSIPNYFSPSFTGVDQAGYLFFVSSDAACAHDIALRENNRYCPSGTRLAISRFLKGDQQTTEPAVISFREDAGSAGLDENGNGNALDDYEFLDQIVLAEARQVGTTLGLAHHVRSQSLFVGSFVRRHAALGPTRNPTTIYRIITSGPTPRVEQWLTLDPSRPEPHQPPAPGLGMNWVDRDDFWPFDGASFDDVFKEGLGDLELSGDGRTLYTVDLGTRDLVAIEVGSDGSPGPVTRRNIVTGIDSPALRSECTDDLGAYAPSDIRPFGLAFHDGLLYLGVVCSGQSTINEDTELPLPGITHSSQPVTRPGDRSKLRGYVYTFDGDRFSRVIAFPLTYDKACATAFNGRLCENGGSGLWVPWVDKYPFTNRPGENTHDNVPYPQPVISDIEFDRDGMILGLADRWSYQTGPITFTENYPQNNGQPGVLDDGHSSGDVLRACRIDDSTWIMERLISGDDRCSTPDLSRQSGGARAIDEYYFQDDYSAFNVGHADIGLGMLAQLPGRGSVLNTTIDPVRTIQGEVFDNGVSAYDRETGMWTRAYLMINGSGDNRDASFEKASGLGDIEGLCPQAPIQIGNRVWRDTDRDGLQDPGEPGIAGVTLVLVDVTAGGVEVGRTVTDSQGTYTFGGPTNSGLISGTSLNPETTYEIRVVNDQPALDGLIPTVPTNGSSIRDSNGNSSDSSSTVATVTTGTENDFSIDLGFVPAPVPNEVDSPPPPIPPLPEFPVGGNEPPPIIPPVSVPETPSGEPGPTTQEIFEFLVGIDTGGHDLFRNVKRAITVRKRGARKGYCRRLPKRVSQKQYAELENLFLHDVWAVAWGFSFTIPSMDYYCMKNDVQERLAKVTAALKGLRRGANRFVNSRACSQSFRPAQVHRRRIKRTARVSDRAMEEFRASFPPCP